MKEKARYIVLTDIHESRWNRHAEIDDIQSLIRLLLYSNDIDLEGIVPCSSCFLKTPNQSKQLGIVRRIIDAYAEVKPNLDAQAKGYPGAAYLHGIVHPGIGEYGAAPGRGFAHVRYEKNPGAACIIRAVDSPDPRPVWIGIWGGSNTLAQAIWQVSKTRSEPELDRFLSKLRIYSISDQDMAGKWIRQAFGDRLVYVVTPSEGTIRGSREYFRAVWPGISGDHFSHGSEDGTAPGGFTGARWGMIDTAWLEKNIISVGSYGNNYPRTVYLTEGDTPAFLGLIPNGLNVPEHPEYGGWGGRHVLCHPEDLPFPNQERYPVYSGGNDEVMCMDGKLRCSPQASLWRWREDFQNDFAVRMQWTVHNRYADCIHTPVIHLNVPDKIIAQPGKTLTLDASASESPDGLPLSFLWHVYPEAGNYMGAVRIDNHRHAQATIHIPNDLPENTRIHLILEVSERRILQTKSYRRIILMR